VQKFIFVKTENALVRDPVNISAFNSTDDFHKYNLDQYHKCKNDDTRIAYPMDSKEMNSHGYYIIAIEWMSVWRDFVNGKASTPGEIDNQQLVKKIKNCRDRKGFPSHDSDLGLQDKRDFYILSVKFFKFFYDTYGCNQII
jgi:hypothetical protein